jgi:hypothetical protein
VRACTSSFSGKFVAWPILDPVTTANTRLHVSFRKMRRGDEAVLDRTLMSHLPPLKSERFRRKLMLDGDLYGSGSRAETVYFLRKLSTFFESPLFYKF